MAGGAMLTSMLHPRTIRAWLRRGNLVLAALLVWVTAGALSSRPVVDAVPELGASAAREPGALIQRPVEDLDALLALVRRFHAHGQTRFAPVAPEPADGTRLPLRAFQVAMVIRQQGGDDTLMLVSKDPSRKETYYLRGSEPDEDCVLLSARYDEDFGYFHVRRGEEAFTFKFCFDEPARSSTLRRVSDRPVLAEGGSPSATSRHPGHASNVGSVDLKLLPFYGRAGEILGARVTGVRPGSWGKRLGLQPGDVIRSAQREDVRNVSDLRARLAEGWRPEALTIERDIGRNRVTLELKGS